MSEDEPGEHYFSADPATPQERRTVDLTLRGHPVRVSTSTGVFSHERVDLGTQVLLRYAPALPEDGAFLDLGCGWGALAIVMALDAPAARVWAVDVNTRAVTLTADNAAALGLGGVTACEPDGAAAEQKFDVIWSNPPIRIGKPALHELLLRWLPRLRPGGSAYLVVQRHLGADSLMSWLIEALGAGYEVARLGSAKGYRVLAVHRRP